MKKCDEILEYFYSSRLNVARFIVLQIYARLGIPAIHVGVGRFRSGGSFYKALAG